jgi:hypothetical protein
VALDPSLLRGDFGVKNWTTGETYTRDYLASCYRDHRELVGILQDLERGIITLSIRDYEAMPAVTIEAWLLYKSLITEQAARSLQGSIGT